MPKYLLNKWQRSHWLRAIHFLRKRHQCSKPIKVRTCSINKDEIAHYYYPTKNHPYYLIKISPELNLEQRTDYLMHEWAHCLDADQNGYREDELHSKHWAQFYSKIYNDFVENFNV